MTDYTVVEAIDEIAPEPPPKGPLVWLRHNMFSTIGSGILSVLAVLLVIFVIRGLMGFVFSPERQWGAITVNMRLLMIQAYPPAQFARVWVAVAIPLVLIGATFAAWRVGGNTSRRTVGGTILGIGALVVLAGVLGPFTLSTALVWIVVGAVLAGGGYVLRIAGGEAARQETIPVLGLALGLIVLGLVAIWVLPLPVPAKLVDGMVITDPALAGDFPQAEQTTVWRGIASSTTIPWTIIVAVGVLAFALVRFARDRMSAELLHNLVVAGWILSFPVIVLVILRDPDIDYGKVLSFYLPVALVFAVLGSLLLNYVASPSTGEIGRVLGAVVLVAALISFLFPMSFLIRFLLLGLAGFTLAAPTFGGEGAGRRRFLGVWVATALITAYLFAIITAPSTVAVLSAFFLGGLSLTILLAVTAIAASFPIGVLLALGRTSTMPIFRMMSTVFIEVVRGVPLITWLLIATLMFPITLPPGVEIGRVIVVIIAMTMFSAAYLAENVRGGLQSIGKGQYEASKALGMTTAQMTVFITLPQALRAVIPALVGQVIAIFKDTSLVVIVSLFDFLFIARNVIPQQSQPFNFLGALRETLLFAAVVYWMFTFTFSRLSQRLEKKLGVGER